MKFGVRMGPVWVSSKHVKSGTWEQLTTPTSKPTEPVESEDEEVNWVAAAIGLLVGFVMLVVVFPPLLVIVPAVVIPGWFLLKQAPKQDVWDPKTKKWVSQKKWDKQQKKVEA